jgi:hypothetical protein
MSRIFDFAVFPVIIFLLAFSVNFSCGVIDTMESGQYLSCVNAVFHGNIPYRDFIPPVGPFFIWILSIALFLFGKTIYTLKLYFLIATIAVYIILYFFGRSLYRFRISACILPVIALVETYNPFWATRWAGYSRMGSGLLGLFLQVIYIKKKNPAYLFLAGVAAAFALLYGIDSGVFLIICGLCLCVLMGLYETNKGSRGNAINIIQRGIIFCSGLAVILIPFMLYMAFNKAFLPYLEGTYLVMRYHMPAWHTPLPSFLGSFEYYNNSIWLFFSSDEFRIYIPRIFYFLAAIYAIYAIKNRKSIIDSVAIPVIVVYGIFAYISACRVVQGPQFDTGFLPLLLLLVYFIEKGVIFLVSNRLDFMKKEKFKKIAFGGIIAVFVILISSLYIIYSYKRVYGSWPGWLEYQKNKNNIIPVYSSLRKKDDIKLVTANIKGFGPILANEDEVRQMEAVTEYLANNTSKGEPVFTFPEHGLYNFLADRPAATRFYIAAYAHTADKWKKELLSELQKNPPRYVVYSRQLSHVAKNARKKNELLPEVAVFILENYHLEKEFGRIGIYKRNL